MNVSKLCPRGGIIIGALIILIGCSSEELTQNTYKKSNDSIEVVPKKTGKKGNGSVEVVPGKTALKKVTGTSVETSKIIARVMNPKVLLKKTLDGVEDLIGKANFTRKEGSAVVLQYKKDWCVLDIFFYGREGQQVSTYYEFRAKEKTDISISECFNKMVRN